MAKMKTNNMQFASLRTLDDFLLGSARFQMPNIYNFEKWGNRVTNNLLYYQSNYILASFIIFMIFTVLHPIQMMVGTVLVLIVFFLFCLVTKETGSLGRFKRNHPLVVAVVLFAVGYYLFGTMIGSLLIFFLAILVPFVAIFIHSSLRLRSIKNRLTNKAETMGLKHTPMGVFFESMGLEKLGDLLKGTSPYHSSNKYIK